MICAISLDNCDNNNTFEAGSVICGTIDIVNDQKLYAQALRVTFKGEERTRVVDKVTKQKSEAACTIHSFVEELSWVFKSGRLKAGKLKVPFEIPIPEGLPQSITIPWTHVSYFVGYELEDRKGRMIEQGTIKVNILAKPIVHKPIPFLAEPFTQIVKKNRFKKGHIVITVQIKDTVLEPGQTIGVSVAVCNRSPLKISKVKAMLRQDVHATAVQNERSVERILTFHEFKEYRKTKRKRKKWLRGTDPNEDFEEVSDELESEEHDGMLRVPKNATLTYSGQLFDVKHDLYVQITTNQKDPIDIYLGSMTLLRKAPEKNLGSLLLEEETEEHFDDGSLSLSDLKRGLPDLKRGNISIAKKGGVSSGRRNRAI